MAPEKSFYFHHHYYYKHHCTKKSRLSVTHWNSQGSSSCSAMTPRNMPLSSYVTAKASIQTWPYLDHPPWTGVWNPMHEPKQLTRMQQAPGSRDQRCDSLWGDSLSGGIQFNSQSAYHHLQLAANVNSFALLVFFHSFTKTQQSLAVVVLGSAADYVSPVGFWAHCNILTNGLWQSSELAFVCQFTVNQTNCCLKQ